MGQTLCASLGTLGDPSGSLHAHSWSHRTTFVRVRPPLLQVRLLYRRYPTGLSAAGMLPWAQGFAILYTILVAACMLIISLGGLFLAVLRD